jgi:ATP-dependent DNA helicase DinG
VRHDGRVAGTVRSIAAKRALDALDRATGALAAGEAREGQRSMCAAIADGIAKGRHGVFRAPTGSGKSAAYLAAAVTAGKRVIIATASINLQDQLAAKDLPHMAEHGGVDAAWAVLKGRANYVCQARLWEREQAKEQGRLDLEPSLRAKADLARIAGWALTTATGDRAELPEEPDPDAWRQVSVGGDECPGAKVCPQGSTCFAERAVAAAKEADVLVVSTHLYALHLAVGGYLLPEHDVVVFDEAHEVEDVFASVLGVSLTPGRIRWLATAARASSAGQTATVDACMRAALALQEALEPLNGQRIQPKQLPVPLVAALGRCAKTVETLVAEARRAATFAKDKGADDAHAAAQRTVKAGSALVEDLARPAAAGEDSVVFVESGALRVSPLDLASTMRDRLWEAGVTGILTSATVDDRMPHRLGLPDTVTVEDVASTFDHKANGMLYVPRLPDPRQPGWEAAALDELVALIEAAGGRTLALFTSWARTTAFAKVARERLSTPVLLQGEIPRGALLRRFVDEESASLFATTSFWQGVDAPGRTCILVTLDRLPFPRPDEPLLQARRERVGDDAFNEVDLPRAATLLAQGVGRLLRTRTDQGVVAVLDKRLAEASYRRTILDALPPLKRTRDRSDAVAFLHTAAGTAATADAATGTADAAADTADRKV